MMNQHWLIISYEPLATSLQRHLKACYHKYVEILILPRRFFDEEIYYNIVDYDKYFEVISKKLNSYKPSDLRHLVVIFTKWVDELPPSLRWNPILFHSPERRYAHPQEMLLSWLLLSFPEVHWWFFSSKKFNTWQISLENFHFFSIPLNLKSKIDNRGFVPLFDPTRFRNQLRICLNAVLKEKSESRQNSIPVRPLNAAAVDEEPSYAYFNAYTAYKFGYCSWSITTLALFEHVFKEENNPCELIFEDLYINFPDRPSSIEDALNKKQEKRLEKFESPGQERFSYLPFRDEIFPSLKNLRKRIFITVGHKRGGTDRIVWLENVRYLKLLKSNGQKNKILYKPFAGVFDLWKKAGLWKRVSNQPLLAGEKNDGIPEKNRFQWPFKNIETSEQVGGHSAPGRILVIAQTLINRARVILNSAQTVPDAVHAAVLALEAKELLGNRTPTTSLEALALQHEAEITAESMFYGIEYNLNVKDRFKEIEREVKAISRWFHPRHRKRSELNARLAIVEKLAKRFNQLQQFEEEQECLAEARKIRFEFWMRQKPWRWLMWPVLKYLDNALFSLPRFFAMVGGWIVFFGLLYYFVGAILGANPKVSGFWDAFSSSTVFFFTLQSPDNWYNIGSYQTLWNFILAFQGFISFFNLTLLLTNIYLIISRR